MLYYDLWLSQNLITYEVVYFRERYAKRPLSSPLWPLLMKHKNVHRKKLSTGCGYFCDILSGSAGKQKKPGFYTEFGPQHVGNSTFPTCWGPKTKKKIAFCCVSQEPFKISRKSSHPVDNFLRWTFLCSISKVQFGLWMALKVFWPFLKSLPYLCCK